MFAVRRSRLVSRSSCSMRGFKRVPTGVAERNNRLSSDSTPAFAALVICASVESFDRLFFRRFALKFMNSLRKTNRSSDQRGPRLLLKRQRAAKIHLQKLECFIMKHACENEGTNYIREKSRVGRTKF